MLKSGRKYITRVGRKVEINELRRHNCRAEEPKEDEAADPGQTWSISPRILKGSRGAYETNADSGHLSPTTAAMWRQISRMDIGTLVIESPIEIMKAFVTCSRFLEATSSLGFGL